DLRAYTDLLYRAASEGLASYAHWKEERRYLDYTDMEEQALALLDDESVRQTLGERIELLVVDEFQDTSPLQLALFTKLAELAQRSVWVGDRKQSIYAFRGADPVLMDAVIASQDAAGGKVDTLDRSYRSRKALVDFASELFAKAFARDGYRDEEVRVDAERAADSPALAKLPPLGLFVLDAKAQKDETQALAEGIRQLLDQPEKTPVVDRMSGEVRPLRASDVAVLVCTNSDAKGLAKALAARNVATIVPRAGLLRTPVGTLVHAGLRLVVDAGDTGARAIASALRGWDGHAPDEWLEKLVREHHARIEARKNGQASPPRADEPLQRFAHLSPSECVDALLAEWQLPQLATRWPQPEIARANLEAMRALAGQYEEECRAERRGGSLVGLLRFLDEAEADEADAQHAGGADAVEIATYHRSKGLEWPVVIAWSLDNEPRGFGPTPTTQSQSLQGGGRSGHFQPTVESDAKKFDPKAPLEGRWIRFYPWPYGALKTGDLVDSVAQSQPGRTQIAAAAREALRLLYVGVTRARDHLILAVKAKPPTKSSGETEPSLMTTWLDTLHDGNAPLIVLPSLPVDRADLPITIAGSKLKTMARVWRLGPGLVPPQQLETPTSRQWFASGARTERSRFYIAPSRAATEWPELAQASWDVELHELGGMLALDLKGRAMDEVGTAIHAFFAADPMDESRAARVTVAQRILAARGYLGLTRPEELVDAHDRLRRWVDGAIPGGMWHREVPVVGTVGGAARRQVRGAIDLLVSTPERSIIVDHKSFPGSRAQAIEKAKTFAGQLSAYACLVGGTPGIVLHMPVVGCVVQCS
ncbi:MAG: UvrD-helicase domain-containing protein, partial [Polyangia bacterium]